MNSLISILFIPFLLSSINADISVADFGAKGDGKIDDNHAFLGAWTAACNSLNPITIYVPRKRYLLSPIVFEGPCKNSGITFRLEGILVAPDYKKMGSSENWLMFDRVEGVSVIGGYLDGQGTSLWACKGVKKDCPAGASVCICLELRMFLNSFGLFFFVLTKINGGQVTHECGFFDCSRLHSTVQKIY